VVLVRKRTMPIERSPPVSEASANSTSTGVNYRVKTIDKGNKRDVGHIHTMTYNKTFCCTVDAATLFVTKY
jgi:hypothetical protein